MSFSFTPKQLVVQKMLRGPARHNLIYGGARSGKTFLFVRAILTRASIAPGSRHLIARLRTNAVRSAIGLDTLPKVMSLCFPGVKLKEHLRDGFFELPNEAQIWLGGLNDKERVEKILGQEYVTILFNEGSQIPYSSVLVGRTRLAQVVQAKVAGRPPFMLRQRGYYDLNPVGTKHWSYQEFVKKIDPVSGMPLLYPDNFACETLNPIDNAENLSPDTLQELQGLPERQRRRFFEGQFGTDIDGALWPAELIAACRIEGILPGEIASIIQAGGNHLLPAMRRIVVAVDPSGTAGPDDKRSDSVGIVVVGLGVDGRGYVLADLTCDLSPAGWGRVAVDAYYEFGADCIIAETNFGGAMVEHVISTTDDKVPFREVKASRGKWVRAEPVAVLYEKDKVRHVGRFPKLEDEMENFSAAGYQGAKSPDRVDALVWGLTELKIDPTASTGMLDFYRAQSEENAPKRIETHQKALTANGNDNAPLKALPAPPGMVTLLCPPGTHSVFGLSRQSYTPDDLGIIRVLAEDAPPLKRAGFVQAQAAA